MDALQEYFSCCQESSSESDESSWPPPASDSKEYSETGPSSLDFVPQNPAFAPPLKLQHVFVGQEQPLKEKGDEEDFALCAPETVYRTPSPVGKRSYFTQQILFSQFSTGFPVASFLSETCRSSKMQQKRNLGSALPRVFRASSYIPEDEALLQYFYDIRERQDAILFDAICALRQVANKSFVYVSINKGKVAKDSFMASAAEVCGNDKLHCSPFMSPRRWCIRKKVWKEFHSLGVENYARSLQPLLSVASDVADLKQRNDAFRHLYSAAKQTDHLSRICIYAFGTDVEMQSFRMDKKNEALGNVGCATLLRFSSFIEEQLDEFFRWVLQLLELHSSLRERRRAVPMQDSLAWVWEEIISPFSIDKGIHELKGSEHNGERMEEDEKLGRWESCLPFRRVSRTVAEKDPLGDFFPFFFRDSRAGGSITVSQCPRLHISSLVTMVQQNALPLRRWLTVLEESQCFQFFSQMIFKELAVDPQEDVGYKAIKDLHFPTSCRTLFSHMSASEFAFICVKQSAALLDFLVVRSSELQNACSFDLYRCYMMLVIHLSWPYFDLFTAAMHGFVRVGELDVWKQLLPRMFRVSFSHLRPSGAEEENPTDVLSLILNCVEYYQEESTWNHFSTDFSSFPTDTQHLRYSSSSRELSELVAARQFILRSCAAFCRPKGRSSPKGLESPETKKKSPSHSFLEEGLTREDRNFDRCLPLGFAMSNAKPQLCLNEEKTELKRKPSGNLLSQGAARDKEWMLPSLWSLQKNEACGSSDIMIRCTTLSSAQKSHYPDPYWNASNPSKTVVECHAANAELWINIAIPCTRWLAAALLIPFGKAVRELQRRRVNALYVGITSLSYSFNWEGVSLGSFSPLERPTKRRKEMDDSFCERSSYVNGEAGQHEQLLEINRGSSVWSSVVPSPPIISLPNALRLIIDVALFGSHEHIVDRFIRQLYLKSRELQWWKVSQQGMDNSMRGSTIVSSIFSEAIHGLPHSHLVQLAVTPLKRKTPPLTSCICAEGSHPPSAEIGEMKELLDAFARFELRFFFPSQLAQVLLPRKLSWCIDRSKGQFRETYGSFFWQERRAEVLQDTYSMSFLSGFTCAENEETNFPCGSVGFADVWSSIFGYLVSLHYAQISLQEQRKSLQRNELQAHELQHIMPFSNSYLKTQKNLLSRSVGVAFYALSFVLDTLVRFTMQEVFVVVYELEKAFLHRRQFDSGPFLCKRLDQLLLQLQLVCFPAEPLLCPSREESLAVSTSEESVRTCITDILCLALDPSRFPFRLLGSKTKDRVERLIYATSSSAIQSPLLHMRLNPLMQLLTFNQYYGDASEGYCFR